MHDFIERLKAKPQHVRERFAFFSSAGITALVALVWITTIGFSNHFALSSTGSASLSSLTEEVGATTGTLKQEYNGLTGLLAGAGAAGDTSTSSAARIEVVDGTTTSTLEEDKVDERTVIPF